MTNSRPLDFETPDSQTSYLKDDAAFAAFARFSSFFCELFSQPGLLAEAECRQSHRDYVPKYYAHIFGPNIDPLSSRHLKWYRRLAAVLSLPQGASILDYGGGYGMDTIFLASLGFKMFFYEITPHHIGAARWFAERFAQRFGPSPIEFVLAQKDPLPSGLDAVLLDEVAHHIEPPQRVFDTAARILRPGGRIFLLEPNFWSPAVQLYFFLHRGFRTVETLVNEDTGERYQWGNEHIRPIAAWNRLAAAAGFACTRVLFLTPWLVTGSSRDYPRYLERLPLARGLVASSVTLEYVRQ